MNPFPGLLVGRLEPVAVDHKLIWAVDKHLRLKLLQLDLVQIWSGCHVHLDRALGHLLPVELDDDGGGAGLCRLVTNLVGAVAEVLHRDGHLGVAGAGDAHLRGESPMLLSRN
jgi:hypothetical protein